MRRLCFNLWVRISWLIFYNSCYWLILANRLNSWVGSFLPTLFLQKKEKKVVYIKNRVYFLKVYLNCHFLVLCVLNSENTHLMYRNFKTYRFIYRKTCWRGNRSFRPSSPATTIFSGDHLFSDDQKLISWMPPDLDQK